MKIGSISLSLAAASMAIFASGLLQASSSNATQTADQSREATRLLRDIRSDAVQVRTAARHLDELTRTSGATWVQYDRQWNEIKPSVEDMQMKLARLEAIRAISSNERKEIGETTTMIEDIQARTHELRVLLDKPGVQTNDVKFKTFARSLTTEAGRLERTASS